MMNLQIADASLRVVPSIHFRVAFAECVYRLCVDKKTRPDAITVELGPQTAAAAAAWLGELGVGPTERTELPRMLGLAKVNLRIKPSKREMAIQLQRQMKRELSDLPPELLKELLGYSALRLLYLSPTDSIIEAIRCALELSVPLYGVDLDETAEREPADAMLEDPNTAEERIDQYVKNNAGYADYLRDEEVDSRREVAIATRLKTVLSKHKKVLFTGGLAHWFRLQKLLSDPNHPPAPVLPVSEIKAEGFTRLVVHPLLAIYHLDLFPAFAEIYEKRRQQANWPQTLYDPIDTKDRFRRMLQAAYNEHFRRKDAAEQLDRLGEDGEAFRDFERLLANFALVRHQSIPDIFTSLIAARGTMSPQFCETLANKLMEHAWVKPEDHTELSCLMPVPVSTGNFVRAEILEPNGERSGYSHIMPLPGGSGLRLRVPIPWLSKGIEWGGKAFVGPRPSYDEKRSWTPWDRTMTAMALRARDIARGEREQPRIEVFEGSLLDGIHVKATLRSYIRKENRIYVHERRRPPMLAPRYHDGWPIVWIFRMTHGPESKWKFAYEKLEWFRTHVRDRDLLNQVERERGEISIWMIDFCHMSPHADDPHNLIDRYALDGILNYAPTHFTLRQTARWAEDTEYKRMPVWRNGDDVKSFFKAHHNLDVTQGDWRANLVQMAIPYASTAVTVVAPDGFSLPEIAFEQARRRRVEVRMVPLSYFPKETVRTLSMLCFVPVENEPTTREYHFVDYAERVLGEKPTANKDILPPYWLSYAVAGS